jgi:hypothetical protein
MTLALGIDCSTVATALVVVDEDGYRGHRLVQHKTKDQGARRLATIRGQAFIALQLSGWKPDVCAVEVPLNVRRSFALESCAAVVMEAVQAFWPHLIVLDPVPSTWQSWVLESRVKDKRQALAYASSCGLETLDDNLADALCIAEYARALYGRDVLGVAA